MARLLHSGAELQATQTSANGNPDGHLGGTSPTFDTTTFRSGAAAWKATCASGGFSAVVYTSEITFAAANTFFAREYAYWDGTETPAVGLWLMSWDYQATTVGQVFLEVRAVAGTTLTVGVSYVVNGVTTQVAGTVDLLGSTWNRLELSVNVPSAQPSTPSFEGRANGVTLSTGNVGSGTYNTTGPISISFGNRNTAALGSTSTVRIDDVAVNDSTGAAQNSWPGDGKVVLLKPISDNAVGTGWVLGANTAIASNGFGSVDNTPPTGVADLAVGSDPKQIRNATAAANSNYDANLTTYTNAGIAAADTVNVLLPIVATAAPVTTSAKAGTIGISSNPVIANIALSAAGTSGAFWSGTTAGAYPTGWKWSFGTLTYLPSVTLGNSPVARITQVTSSTRIAMVCALGMYVDYTPAAVAAARTPAVVMAPYIPT